MVSRTGIIAFSICTLIGLLIIIDDNGGFEWFAETKYGWILTDNANPYMDTSILNEEELKEWALNNGMTLEEYEHNKKNYQVDAGGKVHPLTILNEEELKIQKEEGCVACHD